MNTMKSVMITILSLIIGFLVLSLVVTIVGYTLLAITVVVVLVTVIGLSYKLGSDILEEILKKK